MYTLGSAAPGVYPINSVSDLLVPQILEHLALGADAQIPGSSVLEHLDTLLEHILHVPTLFHHVLDLVVDPL